MYDVVFTYDIVRQNTILASRTYDIVGRIVYDIVGQTYEVVYDFAFTYDVVRRGTALDSRIYCGVVCDIVGFYKIRIRYCTCMSAFNTMSWATSLLY